MNSQQIQGKIKEFCTKNNLFYSRLEKAGRGRPDVMIVVRGITYYFEVKSGKDVLRPAQKIVRNILNKDMEICFTVWSFEEFYEIYVKKLDRNFTVCYKGRCNSGGE